MGRVKRVLTGKSEIVLNKGGSIAAPTFFAHFSFHVTSATIFVACTAISWPQFLDNSALKLEPQTPNEPNFSHQASFDRITFFAPFIFPVVCENTILTVKLWTTVGWGGEGWGRVPRPRTKNGRIFTPPEPPRFHTLTSFYVYLPLHALFKDVNYVYLCALALTQQARTYWNMSRAGTLPSPPSPP